MKPIVVTDTNDVRIVYTSSSPVIYLITIRDGVELVEGNEYVLEILGFNYKLIYTGKYSESIYKFIQPMSNPLTGNISHKKYTFKD